MSETSLWPYTERNGVDATADVESLLRDPEVYLDDQEKTAVYAFAEGIFEGYLTDNLHVVSLDVRHNVPNLKAVKQMSTVGSRQSFYTDYFNTEAGARDARNLGLDVSGDTPVRAQLYELSMKSDVPDAKLRKDVAARSLKWYKQELSERLKQDKANDAQQPDGEVVTVNFDPESLFDKFSALQAYRSFYRRVRRSLREEAPSALNGARLVMLDIYYARVNSLVADLYPALQDLAWQLSYLPHKEGVGDGHADDAENGRVVKAADWRERLISVAPVAAAALEKDEADRAQYASSLARRLDLVRNGAAARQGEHNYSPITDEVLELVEELSRDKDTQVAPETQLDPEVIEYMGKTKWDAAQMKQFCEAVLEEWDILSEHQVDWREVDDRTGYAPDEKWQVVISSKVSSLGISGEKRVVTVPETFDRTLIQVSPAGALPGAVHELTHLWGHQFSDQLAERIPIASIKGKRYITGYEMGGIYQEREFHKLVGQIRPTNVTYLRALEAKLAGANQTEAARAFAEAKSGDITPQQAQSAGKNVLRLYRQGGHDSQALDYIEQELLVRALSVLPADEIMAVSIAGGTFSLRDTAALHRYGLVELPRQVAIHPAQDVWRVFLRDFYPDK